VIIARLALFLIDRHRSRDVLVWVLGESFAGTLERLSLEWRAF
jgi:hypothetical protein